MKQKIFILFVLFSLSVNSQEFKTPNSYFNYIGVEKEAICNSIWKYNVALAHSQNVNEINKLKRVLLENIKTSFEKISLLENGFNGDLDYKNSYLEYLRLSEKQINLNFEKFSSFKNFDKELFLEYDRYLTEKAFLHKNIIYQSDILNKNQVAFAKKYGFNFEATDNELTKKMKIAVEVFDNHSDMYTIYLKAYVNQTFLRTAIKSKDLKEVELILKNSEKIIQEGLDKLKIYKPYKNDILFTSSTKLTLESLKIECNEYGKIAIDYLQDYIKFSAYKSLANSEKEESLREQKIKEFNKMIDVRNEKIKKFNEYTLKFDLERTKNYDNWNKSGELFIKRYVPIR